MKKAFYIFLLLYFSVCLIPSNADSFDDFSNLDRMWDGQKTITNKEFEQVMEKLEEKKQQKQEKAKQKKRKSLFGGGTTLHSELKPDKELQEVKPLKQNKDGVLLNIPVDLIIDGNLLERGYYNVVAQRDEETKKINVLFYQSQFLKGKVDAIETEDDCDQDTIDFAKILPQDDSFVKLIFGSLDFNLYSFIQYQE